MGDELLIELRIEQIGKYLAPSGLAAEKTSDGGSGLVEVGGSGLVEVGGRQRLPRPSLLRKGLHFPDRLERCQMLGATLS